MKGKMNMAKQRFTTTKLAIDKLHAHPDNPRKDVGDVTELAESIRKNGVMQNLTVFPDDDSMETFTVLIGHRRLAACKEAGVYYVPCSIIFEDIPNREEQIMIMLEENMQRQDLTPWEEAESFQLCLDLGGSVEKLEQKTGFSEKTIKRRLEIAKLKKDTVERKRDDGYFQWSLTDLYEVAKIKDVNERDKILNNARDSSSLRYMVIEELKREERKKTLETIIPVMQAAGLKEAPKDLTPWDNRWEQVKSYDLTDKKVLESEFYFPDTSDKRYLLYSNRLYIMQKKKEEPKKEAVKAKTKEQIEAEAVRNDFLEMQATLKTLVVDAIESLVFGEIEFDIKQCKGTENLLKQCWKVMVEWRAYPGKNEIGYFHAERAKSWNMTDEQRDKAKKAMELPEYIQMVAAVGRQIDAESFSLANYHHELRQTTRDRVLSIVNLLYFAGFDLPDDYLPLLTGTHEYYKGKVED